MNDNESQVQMGTLSSNVTVIDEDQLLTPAQLERITRAVIERIDQQMINKQRRSQDQAIARTNANFGKNKGAWR